jgi:hypothetical protein
MKRERNGRAVVGAEERRRWVERYRASGLGLKAFAQQHGLGRGQLHYWVYAPPPGPRTGTQAPVFQEVRLTGSLASLGGWATEIVLASGVSVRLREGTAPEWAVALVQALQAPCSR